MSKSKQAPINYVLTILFIFIIAILSENFGKYYLAEMEFDKIHHKDPITKPVVDNSTPQKTNSINQIRIKKSLSKEYYKKLNKLAQNAQQYAKKHNLNKKYCLLVDYSLPSGTPRCFLWDFKNNNLKAEIHALHGSGSGSTPEKSAASNSKKVLYDNAIASSHSEASINLISKALLSHITQIHSLHYITSSLLILYING